ncbi:HAD-IB family hydrolase [Candidatus Saccharibacteria bacterium CPR2]|nr:HAD-IB family hydrolase [Candidatus Saccharibacteria bacterium CPR2]
MKYNARVSQLNDPLLVNAKYTTNRLFAWVSYKAQMSSEVNRTDSTVNEQRNLQRSSSPRTSAVFLAETRKQADVAKKPFAVFDIDGTLIRWQLYHAVVDRLAKKGLLGNHAHEKLKEARMVWKRREYEDAFNDYQEILVKIYEKALPNIPVDKFHQIVDEIAGEYKEQIYTYTRDLIYALKKQNYFLIAISGSHKELISHIAQQYKFDEWVGTEYKHSNNRFTGERFLASSYKEKILRKIVTKHNLEFKDSYGIGDSSSDIPILEMVENPIAFNPDKELFAHALSQKWKVIVERKNVIYELNYKNGKYELDLAK